MHTEGSKTTNGQLRFWSVLESICVTATIVHRVIVYDNDVLWILVNSVCTDAR